MKRILSLVIATLFLLQGFAAFGDVVWAPESDFYESHKTACSHVGGDYYSNGEKGYIALYKKPDGTLVDYLRNAQKLHIFCTYEDWGMVSVINGTSQLTGKWVKMSDLYRIYDDSSFCEEFADEITQEILSLPAETEKIFIYQYPGAKDPDPYTGEITELKATSRYTDAEGRIWGRVDYYRGIRGEWICFSSPDKVIEPFGGDPNMEKFEKYAADIQLPEVESDASDDPETSTDPEPETPVADVVEPDTDVTSPDTGLEEPLPDNETEDRDTDMEAPESDGATDTVETVQPESPTNQVFLPEEPPLRIPMDPLLIVAIVLVAVAVIAAVVLIIVCYKRKEK